MSDATTEATRMNWADHHEEVMAGFSAAHAALSAIERHVGRPQDARVRSLMDKVIKLRGGIDRALEAILERQLSASKPL